MQGFTVQRVGQGRWGRGETRFKTATEDEMDTSL